MILYRAMDGMCVGGTWLHVLGGNERGRLMNFMITRNGRRRVPHACP